MKLLIWKAFKELILKCDTYPFLAREDHQDILPVVVGVERKEVAYK
jgi:hypothetical protein